MTGILYSRPAGSTPRAVDSAVGRAARARVVERDKPDALAVVRDERDEQLVAVVPSLGAVGRRRSRKARLEALHVVAVEQVVVARRVVCGVAEFADLDANALLDEPDDLVARVGARAGLLYVLARHVRRVGEDASVLRPLVVEEDDEAGAVVR